jgi:hypothetical protein
MPTAPHPWPSRCLEPCAPPWPHPPRPHPPRPHPPRPHPPRPHPPRPHPPRRAGMLRPSFVPPEEVLTRRGFTRRGPPSRLRWVSATWLRPLGCVVENGRRSGDQVGFGSVGWMPFPTWVTGIDGVGWAGWALRLAFQLGALSAWRFVRRVVVALDEEASGGVSMALSSRRCGVRGGVGGGGVLVGGAVAEHGVDDVGAAAGEADEGGVVAFAGGSFAVVVGVADRVGQVGECGEEQGGFEGVVAAFGSGFRP